MTKKLEKDEEKKNRNKKIIYFVGSKYTELDKRIFELWNYVYPLIENPKTSPLINSSYKSLTKDVVLTPTNTRINFSLYKDIETNENKFFISLTNTDRENGKRFQTIATIVPDEYVINTYFYAKELRKKHPNKWRENTKKKSEKIKEKEIKELKQEDKNKIVSLCNKLKIKVKFVSTFIIFYTPFESWLVDKEAIINKETIELYHKNTRKNINDWHKQNFETSDIKEIIKYIRKHDYRNKKIKSKNLEIRNPEIEIVNQ